MIGDGPADALVVDVLPRLERADRGREVQVGVRLARGGGDPLDLLDDVRALPRVRRDGREDADHRAVEVVRVEGLALLRARLGGEQLVERVRGLRTRRRARNRAARALERSRGDEVGDRRRPAARHEELAAVELPGAEERGADLRVVRREVEDDVGVRIALDDVVGLGVVARCGRVVQQRALRLHAEALERALEDRQQPGAERVVAPRERDRLPLPELVADQARKDRRLKRVRRHRAEEVAVVLEVGERRRRVVRPDLRDLRGHGGRLCDRDRAPRGERAEDAVGALRDELPGGVHAAFRRRPVVGVLDLERDVDAGLLERGLRLLHCEARSLRVRRAEHGGRAGEGHDHADPERVTVLRCAACSRAAGDRGQNRDQRDHGAPTRCPFAVHEASCVRVRAVCRNRATVQHVEGGFNISQTPGTLVRPWSTPSPISIRPTASSCSWRRPTAGTARPRTSGRPRRTSSARSCARRRTQVPASSRRSTTTSS